MDSFCRFGNKGTLPVRKKLSILVKASPSLSMKYLPLCMVSLCRPLNMAAKLESFTATKVLRVVVTK
jgi:hypothetical protein